jgi:hypothetical protein
MQATELTKPKLEKSIAKIYSCCGSPVDLQPTSQAFFYVLEIVTKTHKSECDTVSA